MSLKITFVSFYEELFQTNCRFLNSIFEKGHYCFFSGENCDEKMKIVFPSWKRFNFKTGWDVDEMFECMLFSVALIASSLPLHSLNRCTFQIVRAWEKVKFTEKPGTRSHNQNEALCFSRTHFSSFVLFPSQETSWLVDLVAFSQLFVWKVDKRFLGGLQESVCSWVSPRIEWAIEGNTSNFLISYSRKGVNFLFT